MKILGIESSCDDTSVALVDCSARGRFVIREFTASQIDIHKKYGGVVPEIAGRAHAEKITPLLEAVLRAGQKKPDAIAVTAGPGLITGLIVGVEAARALSYAKKIPLLATNHIEGHIHAVEIQPARLRHGALNKNLKKIIYPALALVVSGGHTELIFMKKSGHYRLLGSTRDDAAGECFDKVAKLLGLPYPGGPQIARLAKTGRTDAIHLPRPMLEQNNLDFSFAGLKTAALYWLEKNKKYDINDFCAGFQQAIVDVLVKKTARAAQTLKPRTVVLAGGVAANLTLRRELKTVIEKLLPQARFLSPDLKYCMDNAAMIAAAGYERACRRQFVDWKKIKADPVAELA